MRTIERWKETLNKVGYVYVIFMDTLCTSGCNLEYILKKQTRCYYRQWIFSSHTRELCKKTSQKILVLPRISNQHDESEKNHFIPAKKHQFNYCLCVLMFCSRTSNNKINKVHARALRVILAEDLNDFESLLQNKKDICSHHENIQKVMN